MLKHYLTIAIRYFSRNKGITAINLACLAAGLVCFVFAYGVKNYFEQTDSYQSKAARTYVLTQSIKIGASGAFSPPFPATAYSVADYLHADIPNVELWARALNPQGESSLAAAERKQSARVAYADANFLSIFDLPFAVGSSVAALSQPHSIVLSAEAARRLFGDAKDVLGKEILIENRETVHVTGVLSDVPQPSHISTSDNSAPLNFQALVSMDVHEALIRAQEPEDIANIRLTRPYGYTQYYTYCVLPSGNSALQALKSGLKSFSDRHVPRTADVVIALDAKPISSITTTLLDAVVRTDQTGVSATSLLLTLGALVLLVACVNYANLATAQAATRAKEVALRRVVGATAMQLAAQYLFEAALLVIIALLAAFAVAGVLALITDGPVHVAVTMLFAATGTVRFWFFVVGLITVVSLLASSYPVLVLSRIRPVVALRQGRVRTGSRWLAGLLVGTQFFAASFLLIATTVMMKQNAFLQHSLLIGGGDPVVAIGDSVRKYNVDLNVLRAELLRHPQIKTVTASMFELGIAGKDEARISEPNDKSERKQRATLQVVDYDFLNTVGLKVLAGRDFDRSHGLDVSKTGGVQAGNILIDVALAHKLGWSNPGAALGRTLYVPGLVNGAHPSRPSEIVGVVEDKPLRVLDQGATGTVYQLAPEAAAFPLVRISRSDTKGGLAAIDAVWQSLVPNVVLKRRFLDEQFALELQSFTLVSRVFGDLAGFALLIAVVGLVGMSTHLVSRRIQEMGIRKILGASVGQILVMLLKDLSRPVVIANIAAWPLGFAVAQIYLNLFIQRTTVGFAPVLLSLLATLAVAWACVALHAWRAAKVSPAMSLRYE